jgi:hypothetical protein
MDPAVEKLIVKFAISDTSLNSQLTRMTADKTLSVDLLLASG